MSLDGGVHSRRARPTVRLLAEDLTAGWASPLHLRMLADGNYEALHPLSELHHPLIAKAAESLGHEPGNDNYVGLIASSTTLRLLEIRTGQWRGGVWEDPKTGVCWLVVAGLAKGEHRDHDDFYMRVQRENDSGDPTRWLPTAVDERLLRQESAARLITRWELAVQKQALDLLREVHAGGTARTEVQHPAPGKGSLAQLVLTVNPVREPGYDADEIYLELVPLPSYIGSHLAWQLTLRVLISLSPPEQGWDRYQNSYANIAEPGAWTARVVELDAMVADGELAESEPGKYSHYAHRKHLAGHTIEGRGVRAICGVFFVPTQDHGKLSTCPVCQERFAELEE